MERYHGVTRLCGVWVLAAAMSMLMSACGGSDNENGAGDAADDSDSSVTVSETRVYSGSIRIDSITETALYGAGASTSAGASHLGTAIFTFQPNGTMTIQYTKFAFEEDFFSTGLVYEPVQYTPAGDTIQVASGTYAYGAFNFHDSSGHWVGTFNADLVSGTCTWSETRSEHDGNFSVNYTMSFQAPR
ncbi:MAG: hypothetical protein WCL44_02520 [bacterium]